MLSLNYDQLHVVMQSFDHRSKESTVFKVLSLPDIVQTGKQP